MFRLLLIGALAALAWAYRSMTGPIDGTAWDIHLRRDAFFSLPTRDTIVFDRGQLISEKHLAAGFMPSRYSSGSGDKETSYQWTATADGPNAQALYWQGQIDGNRIEGKLSWVDKRGKSDNFVFHGRKRT